MIVDTETTDLDYLCDEIIEIGDVTAGYGGLQPGGAGPGHSRAVSRWFLHGRQLAPDLRGTFLSLPFGPGQGRADLHVPPLRPVAETAPLVAAAGKLLDLLPTVLLWLFAFPQVHLRRVDVLSPGASVLVRENKEELFDLNLPAAFSKAVRRCGLRYLRLSNVVIGGNSSSASRIARSSLAAFRGHTVG